MATRAEQSILEHVAPIICTEMELSEGLLQLHVAHRVELLIVLR
jgi:hypothetical protein